MESRKRCFRVVGETSIDDRQIYVHIHCPYRVTCVILTRPSQGARSGSVEKQSLFHGNPARIFYEPRVEQSFVHLTIHRSLTFALVKVCSRYTITQLQSESGSACVNLSASMVEQPIEDLTSGLLIRETEDQKKAIIYY